jgi:WD40 repeat protein
MSVVSTSTDDTLRIWSIESRKETHIWEHPYRVWSVDFAPDGQRLLASSQNGTAHVWQVEDGQPALPAVTFSSDLVAARFDPVRAGEFVLTNLASIRFGNFDRDQPTRETSSLSASFRQARYSNDGRFLVASTDQSQIWIFELLDTDYRLRIVNCPGVTDVAFDADNQQFMSASADGVIRIWSAANGKLLAEPVKLRAPAEALALSPDGKWLAIATRDMTVRIWNTESWHQTVPGIATGGIVQGLQFSPDSRILASAAASGQVQLYEVVTGLAVGKPFGHQIFATAVAFSPDGKWLATGSFDKTARLWPIRPHSQQRLGNEEYLEILSHRVAITLGAQRDSDGNNFPLTASPKFK